MPAAIVRSGRPWQIAPPREAAQDRPLPVALQTVPELTISEPSWLLLLWSGLAATLAASVAGAGPGILIGTRLSRRHRVRRHFGRFMLAVLLGVAVYPGLYGLVLEYLGRADLVVGALLGAAHGAVAVLWSALRPPTGRDAPGPPRLLLGHLLYGAILGFLYVVPRA